jgi:phosphoribosylformimino-5-aminoimidazole carboxamide ribotide isomerase
MILFTIYPAIDLRDGKVVRLAQGDPNRQTVYADDPAAAARRWLEAGASWLHVVNLDGAFGEQNPRNLEALQQILLQTIPGGASVQFGGGLRSMDQVERVLQAGVRRAVLGTAAIQSPGLVAALIEKFGAARIAIAMDVRDGQVKVGGWLDATGVSPQMLAEQLLPLGVRTVIHTNIARDGVGGGADIEAACQVATLGFEVIASGGIHQLGHVRAVKQAGLAGVIIGRALYDERFSLEEALEC